MNFLKTSALFFLLLCLACAPLSCAASPGAGAEGAATRLPDGRPPGSYVATVPRAVLGRRGETSMARFFRVRRCTIRVTPALIRRKA